ncbi:MAG: hypothetical protein RLZZ610_426 [Actinomycetota bacterium]|jgi:cytochrome oxidase assembly protein ShyY1
MSLFAKTWLRWLAWFLLALAFAVSCFFLADWQLDRRDQAVSKIQRMVENYDNTALPYASLSDLNQEQVIEIEWSPIDLQGKYLTESELLVRNRPIAGQPGFLQLVPFELSNGKKVLVERGWIPADSQLQPATIMTPSAVEKSLIARVKLGEQTPNRESPEGYATSIHLESLEQILGFDIEQRFYLRLIEEKPSESPLPQPLSKPVLDEGNHLSYAVQWVLFALMGFFALYWAIKQEREFRRMESDPSYVPKSKRKQKTTDADIEDQILDSGN